MGEGEGARVGVSVGEGEGARVGVNAILFTYPTPNLVQALYPGTLPPTLPSHLAALHPGTLPLTLPSQLLTLQITMATESSHAERGKVSCYTCLFANPSPWNPLLSRSPILSLLFFSFSLPLSTCRFFPFRLYFFVLLLSHISYYSLNPPLFLSLLAGNHNRSR